MTSKLLFFLFLLSGGLYSQSMNCVDAINSNIKKIPYVFEGEVVSVEIFAGDDRGNKLPRSSAKWVGEMAHFYDSTGKKAQGYSMATIKICKVYKGKFKKGTETIKVLAKSGGLRSIYLHKSGKDTILNYVPSVSRDDDGGGKVILPASEYYRKIYFCDKIDPIREKDYAGRQDHSNFNSLFEFTYGIPMSMPQPDGSYIMGKAYLMACLDVLASEKELIVFMKKIKTLNPDPKNKCSALK